MTQNSPEQKLSALQFDNTFIRELPADPRSENTRRQVVGSCYSKVSPARAANPKLIAYAREVAELLDLDHQSCSTGEFTSIFAGNHILPGMEPFSMCYGGHQFGNWAGQLGDGRAINLGEVVNRHGQRWVLQLKGAGPTPYSRNADGYAVLRSSVREFLCSEAMHHLGIPTTRALSIVDSGDRVVRDMFYDGHPESEPGAIVCRVSPSFIRFGNFEIFTSRGDYDLLKQLVDYTIRTDYPELSGTPTNTYIDWFAEVCRRTAEMVVHWMRVGFVHGVMNTDNMSILGLTIDYGPYGWLEDYDPQWTPNTTDSVGKRYAFGNQSQIGLWNLVQLANALYPLINDADALQDTLIRCYREEYLNGWQNMMANKLGLTHYQENNDKELIGDLLVLLQETETDMTIFFRQLSKVQLSQQQNSNRSVPIELLPAYYQPDNLTPDYKERLYQWLLRYSDRTLQNSITEPERTSLMNRTNPKYVLRNYIAQVAIEKATEGDYSRIHELLEILRRPYDEQPEKEMFYQKRPEWARSKAGCSMLS